MRIPYRPACSLEEPEEENVEEVKGGVPAASNCSAAMAV